MFDVWIVFIEGLCHRVYPANISDWNRQLQIIYQLWNWVDGLMNAVFGWEWLIRCVKNMCMLFFFSYTSACYGLDCERLVPGGLSQVYLSAIHPRQALQHRPLELCLDLKDERSIAMPLLEVWSSSSHFSLETLTKEKFLSKWYCSIL